MNIKSLLGTIAPWIAGAIGGPIAGTAVKIGLGAIGLTPTGDDQKDQKLFADGIVGASTDQLLALKQADNDFAVKMRTLGFQEAVELEKIAADDRANARAREIAVKDKTPKQLAVGTTLGFFALLAIMAFIPMQQTAHDVIVSMTGSLGTVWIMVMSYYFGSSSGSQKKDETIKSMAVNGKG